MGDQENLPQSTANVEEVSTIREMMANLQTTIMNQVDSLTERILAQEEKFAELSETIRLNNEETKDWASRNLSTTLQMQGQESIAQHDLSGQTWNPLGSAMGNQQGQFQSQEPSHQQTQQLPQMQTQPHLQTGTLPTYGQSQSRQHSANMLRTVKTFDTSATIAKRWSACKLDGSGAVFTSWYRLANSYLTSVNLLPLMLMDAWNTPTSLEDWQRLDQLSIAHSRYKEFVNIAGNNMAMFNSVNYSTPLVELNAAYLAVVNATTNLASSTAAVIEASLDSNSLSYILPPPEYIMHPGSARKMYFGVVKRFLPNTEKARLIRYNAIHKNSAMRRGESIVNFVSRITTEVDILNRMARETWITQSAIKAILKTEVAKLSHEYTVELRFLSDKYPNGYTLQQMTDALEVVWLELNGTESIVLENANMIESTHSEEANYAGQPSSNDHSANSRKHKNKSYREVTHDKNGKQVCWQFIDTGECTFGSNCKFSHNAEAKLAAQKALPPSEIAMRANTQSNNRLARQMRSRRKDNVKRDSETKDKGTSAKQPTGTTFQATTGLKRETANITDHEVANVATTENGDIGNLDKSESDDSYTDTDDVSNSDEFCGMVDSISTTLSKMEDDKIVHDAVADSGATVHIVGSRKLFTGKLRPCSVNVRCANNQVMNATWCGDAVIVVNGVAIRLENALFIPNAETLLSIGRLTDRGYSFLFKHSWCKIGKEINGKDTEVVKVDRINDRTTLNDKVRLYRIPFCLPVKPTRTLSIEKAKKWSPNLQSSFAVGTPLQEVYRAFTEKACTKELIHQRYNHCAPPYVSKINPKAMGDLCLCDACAVGGLRKSPFKKKTDYSQQDKFLEEKVAAQIAVLQDTDAAMVLTAGGAYTAADTNDKAPVTLNTPGPVYGRKIACDTKVSPVTSVRNIKYAYVVLCLETRIATPLLGVNKNDFEKEFLEFTASFYNKFGFSFMLVKFDQGGEFTSKTMKDTLKQKYGCELVFSTTKSSNQNAHVERKIGVLWTAMLKLLAHSGVPFLFWCFAFEYACLVANHIPHRGMNWKRPVDVAGLQALDSKFAVFGCGTWFYVVDRMAHEAKARRGVFLGIDDTIQGWRILDIELRKVIISRDVICIEDQFPFAQLLKPCLIVLKWGVWPKTTDNAELGTDLNTLDIEVDEGEMKSKDDVEEGGVLGNPLQPPSPTLPSTQTTLPHSPALPPGQTTLPLSPGTLPHVPSENMTSTTATLPSVPMSSLPSKKLLEKKDDKANDISKFFGNNDELLSPIGAWGTEYKEWSPFPLNLNKSLGPLNLMTPKLGKKAKKKFEKFRDSDNYFLKSASKNRLDHFKARYEKPMVESKVEVQITPQKLLAPRNNDLVSPVPEKVVDGKPMWTVNNILAQKTDGNGKILYRTRWKGNWKDTWEPEESFANAKELLHNFTNRTKIRYQANKLRKGYKKVFVNPPDVGSPPLTRSKVKYGKQLKNAQKLRRSARLNPRTIQEIADSLEVIDISQETSEDIAMDEPDVDTNTAETGDLFLQQEKQVAPPSDKPSTEFPRPPEYESHHHFVPEDVNLDEIMEIATDEIVMHLGVGDDNDYFEKPPETRSQMLKGNRVDEFLEAELTELKELVNNGTFKVVICPNNRTPITCRWVYDIKRDHNNKIVRWKARLVVQGFKQIEGVDFQKTFSSVAQMRTFRVIIALAVKFGLRVTQYDIGNAFLNAELDTDMYMTFPPGYPSENKGSNEVLKLLKGLYGLKQASRLWWKLLLSSFEGMGLKICCTEPGVLHFPDAKGLCIVNIHVDDYNIATNDEVMRVKIENVMDKLFKVKKMGDIKLYLGIVVNFNKDLSVAELHQGPYHERFLDRYGMAKCKSVDTPGESSVKLSRTDTSYEDDEKVDWPYMSVGGSLMYSALGTRPDIAQRVIQLARFNSNPGKSHIKAQKHLLRFIKGTTHDGLTYTRDNNSEFVSIVAFCDSDWAGCPDTRRSTMGYVVTICGGPVTWKSQLLKTLALSSCEAEFMSLCEVGREIMWLCNFFREIGVKYHVPEVYCDSQSAIYWTEDPIQHQRNKHVELKYYFVRDIVRKELVKVFKIHSKYNPSDPLTKTVTKAVNKELRPVLLGKRKPTLKE